MFICGEEQLTLAVYTYRIAWIHPMQPQCCSQAEFYEGVRAAFAEYSKNYKIDFVETTNATANYYVLTYNFNHNAGAVWAKQPYPHLNMPWGSSFYFNARDTRRWGARYVKSILMHEMLHAFEYNGTHYHSPDNSCVASINATSETFCPAEDSWLAKRFGRRAVSNITVENVTQPEGDLGISNLAFRISLDKPSTSQIKIAYFTSDGTATVIDGDYLSTSGTLTTAEVIPGISVIVPEVDK